MNIYIYTYRAENNRSAICQVYAKNNREGKRHLSLITGCEETLISYHGIDSTTNPLDWEILPKETKF